MSLATLTYADGYARLQVAAPSLIGEAPITMATGAVLRFDPANPTRLLSADIPSGDPDDLAGALTLRADLGEGFDPDSPVRPIAAIDEGGLLPGLQRLAFAQWNARWTPLNVERALVMLDVAVAAWEAGPGMRLRAFDLFDEYVGQLQSLVESEAAERVVAPAVAESLREAVTACAAALSDDPRVAGLVGSAAKLAQEAKTRQFSTAGFRASEEMGLGSVDWANVPPRTLHTDEGHVTWERNEADDLVRYTITATGHPCLNPEAPSADRLLVRLVDESTGRVAAAEPLVIDGTDRLGRVSFTATIDLDTAEEQGELVPDIVDARAALRRAPRVGAAALAAKDERQAIRALAWTRLEAAAATADTGWAPLFARAAVERQDLRDAVSEEPGPAVQATLGWLNGVETAGVDVASPPARPLLSEWIAISRMVRRGAAF